MTTIVNPLAPDPMMSEVARQTGLGAAQALRAVRQVLGALDEVLVDDELAALRGECALATVPGASHLYHAPAAIARVAALAAEWFGEHLAGSADRPSPWGPGGPAHCEEFRPGRPVRAP